MTNAAFPEVFASQVLPVDLSAVTLNNSPVPLQHVAVRWEDVWSQLVGANLTFRSCTWANNSCIVVLHHNRANVRQFALTDRELSVLMRALDGQSQKEIAAAQGLSASTIGASLKSALLKLGFATQKHITPVAALMLSHEQVYTMDQGAPPVYAVAGGECVVAASRPVDWSRVPKLTSSELEITRLLIQGNPNADIARQRKTSLHTVENQVASLLRKAGAKNRFDLLKTLLRPARA